MSHLAVCPGCSVPPYCRSAAAIGKSRRRDGRKRRPRPLPPPLQVRRLYAADRRSAVPAGQPGGAVPDKLLAQVLAGAGYPDQISAADARLVQNRGLQPAALSSAADAQPGIRARPGAIPRRTRSDGEKHPPGPPPGQRLPQRSHRT